MPTATVIARDSMSAVSSKFTGGRVSKVRASLLQCTRLNHDEVFACCYETNPNRGRDARALEPYHKRNVIAVQHNHVKT
jgi:hypothetical protein